MSVTDTQKFLHGRGIRRSGLVLNLLILLAACAAPPQPEPVPAPAPEPVPEPEPPPLQEPKPEPPFPPVSIAAVGDIMIGTDFPLNHLPDDDGVSFLSAVAPTLSGADLAFGNLEGVLLDGGVAVKECKDMSRCYLFRSPPRYAGHLRDAGFDVLSVANNHALDFGEAGRSATMQALNEFGLAHSGRYGDVANFVHGRRSIAIIAFSSTRCSYSLLDIDIAADLVAGLAETHDTVVVSFHGGAEGIDAIHVEPGEEEYLGEKRGNLIEFSHRMIGAGADLVVGHGPHVPRALEIYHDRLIAYSLGNFATYYGISVQGRKGYAPILIAELDEEGRFIGGRIESTIQLRPGGPVPDASRSAFQLMRQLSQEDFPDTSPLFMSDGSIKPRQFPEEFSTEYAELRE